MGSPWGHSALFTDIGSFYDTILPIMDRETLKELKNGMLQLLEEARVKYDLCDQEVKIISLIAYCSDNYELADKIGLSSSGARWYLLRIFKKTKRE